MDFLTIYTVWLGCFSIAFTFLPIMMIMDWRRRKTAEGFSSVNFVLPVFVQACWLRHGLLTNDMTNIIINSLNLVFFAFYISAFAYYQPKREKFRKYLIGQLIATAIAIKAIYTYVDMQTPEAAPDIMGSIAAGVQIFSLVGGIYEIKRAISMGTTEYIPAAFQFAIFTLIIQWFLFGILHGNRFIAIANLAGLVVNIATIALYPIYPPLTWRVPLFNIPPQQKEKKSE